MESIPSQHEIGTPVYHPTTAVACDTDRQLVARIQARNRDAFEILYDRHCGQAMSIALRVLQDRERSEAVILEAYWWLWKHSSLIKDAEGAFVKWFYPVVKHLAITERNRKILPLLHETAKEGAIIAI